MSLYILWEAWDKKRLLSIALFYIFEFGILALALIPVYKKDIVFGPVWSFSLYVPFIKIGLGGIFVWMQVSPAIFKFCFKILSKSIDTAQKEAWRLSQGLRRSILTNVNRRDQWNYFIFSWLSVYISLCGQYLRLGIRDLGDDRPDTYLPNYFCP